MAAAVIGAQRVRTFRPERGLRSTVAETDVALRAGQIMRAEGGLWWRAIVCREGVLWITQDGDVRDHVITAGEMFLVSQPGRVIVQALCAARIEVTPCLATASGEGRVEETVFP